MIYFNNDYSEGCHNAILHRLEETNLCQTSGYGMDEYCASAADKIRTLCSNDALSVHFLVGGTQANLTVIAAALKPYQGVLGPESAHINVHETGAVEATGHKVLSVPSADGKIAAQQVADVIRAHREDDSMEHTVQPKMVYISNPTELGTIYSLAELEALSDVCHKNGLYLFMDGARLGYGLTASENDMTMADIARLCDVFYIGGTKVGALFGEAVVISNPAIAEDFRYLMKQHGGMLAKGWLLGLQYEALLENDLYIQISKHADSMADIIREMFTEQGYHFLVEGVTNQIFPILPDALLEKLQADFTFTEQQRVDDANRAVRFCTSWATEEKAVRALCDAIVNLSK